MSHHKPKTKFVVQIQKTANGEKDYTVTKRGIYAMLFAARGLTLKRSVNGTVYRLCDIEQNVPGITLDCDGVERPVKMVLKVYARIPQKILAHHKDKLRYQALLRGKPILND